ncbi:MAG: sodium:proton antiporter [Chloroflexota bacterium]|nr:sodium:proton antiporter [Chloroflexota bacterium]
MLDLALFAGGDGVVPLLLQAESAEPSDVVAVVQRYAWLLIAATLVGMVIRRFSIPYAVALVLGGLAIQVSHVGTVPDLDPELILFVFLPPLLFDAAFRLDAREARSLVHPILILALPGVLIAAVAVGLVAWVVLDLPLSIALLFGSIVAATDPVAVIGIFRQLKVAHRMSIIAEGESLINDGMAITLYVVLLQWATSGSFNPVDGLSTFGLEVLGGLAIGAALGLASSRLTAFIDDHLIEMLLSVSLAYGSYLTADAVHASGALACVAAGVLHGSYGRAVGMSANTRQLLDDLWEFLGFVANAIVFLLLGLSVHAQDLIDDAWAVTVAVVAVLVTRAVVTAVTGALTPREDDPVRTWQEAALLTWGGLRGALTAALALALPPDTPHREIVTAMAFGVVLFTLVVQGLTLPIVIRRLGLGQT